MSRESNLPAIWLVQRDDRLRIQLAAGLRRDGMNVVEFQTAETALEALRTGARAAILVTEPAAGRLTDRELSEQARMAAPRLEIIFTPLAGEADAAPPAGAYRLPKPLDAFKLSRFIRLVAAKPALRGTLQSRYRAARSGDSAVVVAL